VGASIGISLFPDHCHDAVTLRKLADTAMYDVKRSGKNNFRFAAAQAEMPKQSPD
jgi:GGDEF domain-containing protein